jgi:hypothetical protein
MQNCIWFIGISNHKYDYEPILFFVKPPDPILYGIVNAGQSKARVFGDCRFHKTEVRMRDYLERDRIEESYSFTTSPAPFYPFGVDSEIAGQN